MFDDGRKAEAGGGRSAPRPETGGPGAVPAAYAFDGWEGAVRGIGGVVRGFDPGEATYLELRAGVEALTAAADAVRAAQLGWVSVFDGSGAWNDGTAVGASDWLARADLGLARRRARELCRVAQVVSGRVPGSGPLADAVGDGRLACWQAELVAARVTPPRAALFERDAGALVDALTGLDADASRMVVDRWAALADDVVATSLSASERVGLSFGVLDGSGVVSVRGFLSVETAVALDSRLDELAPHGPDHRPLPVRRADAIDAMLVDHDAGRPRRHRVRHAASVLVDDATLVDDPAAPDVALGGRRTDLLGVGPVPVSMVRRMLCDADVRRVVFGPEREVLDAGRAHRVVGRAQRAALEARDGGCVVRGCAEPVWRCDAHHVVPWELGGSTDLSNLVLLCRRHHTHLHDRPVCLEPCGDGTYRLTRRPAGHPADNRPRVRRGRGGNRPGAGPRDGPAP